MSGIANSCERLIKAGRTAGMAEKLSKLYLFEQLTQQEYDYLMGLLTPSEA